jgi:DNA mismatch endonuclease (patch repair protein)
MEGRLGERCTTGNTLSLDAKPTPQRSALMARVKGKNTCPEMKVRSYLHRQGFRFRLHAHSLPGSPDLIFPSRRIALFVHGCFWHRHGCKATSTPKTRTGFWTEKFAANQARDERNERALRAQGWETITVWECDIKADKFQESVLAALRASPVSGRRRCIDDPASSASKF